MIHLNSQTRNVTLPAKMRLDLGGVAKGWCAEVAAERLSKYAPALVDAGGDIAVSGLRADASAWPVGVENPHDDTRDLALLALGACGVATSATNHRRWRAGGVEQHHIINPRTGEPAQTDVTSATVVAKTAVEAEAGAKMAVLLGARAGLAWIESHQQAALLVTTNGDVLRSTRMHQFEWR